MEGLVQRSLLVSARGTFPALLAFLRRLEALNVLVVQSDLNLTLPEGKGADGKPLNPDAPVVLKLTLGLYSRQPVGAQAAVAAGASGGAPAPGATPAPAPGAPAAPPPAAPAPAP
jgi:hypothetical protein